MDLENLRTAFRFAVELEDKSRIGFGFYIQMKLRGGAFGIFSYPNPTIVEHCGLGYRSGEIQGHGNSAEESPGADAAGGAATAGVDRDFEAELGGEDGFAGELVEIGLAEVESSSDRMDQGVREEGIRRNEGNDGGLKRKILELDFAETGRRRRMNNGARGFGSDGNFEGEVANGESGERARIHGGRERR